MSRISQLKTKVLELSANKKEMRLQTGLTLGSKVSVDESGVVRNVSIITRGPALGHGYDIDDVSLQQVYDSMSRKPNGVKCRFTHPPRDLFGEQTTDPIEILVGRVKATKIENGQVRGDVYFGDYADLSPKGKLGSYLTSIIKSDPEIIGLSIVYIPDEFEKRKDENDKSLPPAMRLRDMKAVDFVGDPGANPDGLLSSKQQTPGAPASNDPGKESLMDKVLLAYLKSCGLKAEATDQEALAFSGELSDEQKVIFQRLSATAAPAPAPGATPPAAPAPVAPSTLGSGPMAVTPEQLKQMIADGVTSAMATVTLPQQLSALAAEHGMETISPGWTQRMLEAKVPYDEAKRMAAELARIFKENEALSVHVTGDHNTDGLSDGVSDALCLAAGVKIEKPSDQAKRFKGMGVFEMGRSYLAAIGVPGVYQLSRKEIADMLMISSALRQRYPKAFQLSMSTGDFPLILGNSLNKSLRSAYMDTPVTWNQWCRRATAPDFKQIQRIAMSEAPSLIRLPEGGEIEFVTLGESRAVYALARFANAMKITFEMIINDDTDAFSRLPMLQGSAAKRLEDESAYSILTTNALMEDGIALFDAQHGNVGVGALLSVASLGLARSMMRLQKGPKGLAFLNLTPKTLIVPTALETTSDQLLRSTVDPALNNNTVNPMQNKFASVTHPLLDATSSTAWFMAASPNEIDTVEVCFLIGAETPQVSERKEFGTGNMEYAVTHILASHAIDHRGLYYNSGVVAEEGE